MAVMLPYASNFVCWSSWFLSAKYFGYLHLVVRRSSFCTTRSRTALCTNGLLRCRIGSRIVPSGASVRILSVQVVLQGLPAVDELFAEFGSVNLASQSGNLTGPDGLAS